MEAYLVAPDSGAGWGGGGGGTRVGFGWVCAAQASKCGPRFRRDLQPVIPRSKK